MIARKVTLAALVVALGQFVLRFIDLLATAIIARILVPEDFGIAALGITTLALLRTISELPVADSLVRLPEVTRDDLDTAFTLNVLRGLFVGALLCLASIMLPAIYDDPRLTGILLLLALAPVFQGLASPAMVHFTRALNFRPMTLTNIFGKLASFLVTVMLAWLTASYWAIIAGMVIAPLISSILTFFLAPHRPGFCLKGARGMLSFAGWITVSQIISSLNQQGDRYFIGGILGTASLGIYAMASTIANMMGTQLIGPLMQPLFAGMSQFSHDHERLGRALLRGQRYLAFLAFPFGAALGALAQPAVLVALGPGWSEAASLLTWLAPAVALQTISTPIHSVLLATGHTKVIAIREGIFFLVRLGPTVLGAIYGGLIGAVMVRSILSPFLILINFTVIRSLIGLSVRQQVVNVMRPVIGSAIVFMLLGWYLRSMGFPPGAFERFLLVLGAIAISICAYLPVSILIWRIVDKGEGPEKLILDHLRNALKWRLSGGVDLNE